MAEITPLAPTVIVVDGHGRTTSLAVAAHFGKRHRDVLRAIKNLEFPDGEHERNFALMFNRITVGQGASRADPYYQMTRDGFVFLVMGFTGKEAARWKWAYINAFNQLEQAYIDRLKEMTTHIDPDKLVHGGVIRPKPRQAAILFEQSEAAMKRLRGEKDPSAQVNIYWTLRYINDALGKPTETMDVILSRPHPPAAPPKLF